jgi:glutamate synthase (NADPH/NADH) small chain
VSTKEFLGDEDGVRKLRCVKIEWSDPDENGRSTFREIPGSEFELAADLVLLAMGFVHVEHGPLVTEFGLERDARGNIVVDSQLMTSVPGVFAAGDSMVGASLVVRAIDYGRIAAEGADRYLASK